MEANILNNEIVFVKKRSDKLQKLYFQNWKHWACREGQFKIVAGKLNKRMKIFSLRRFGFQVLYSWKLWIQMLSVSARLTALSRNLLLCSTFSKWCMLCQDLRMDNKTTSGTAEHFSSTFRQIRLTNELDDMFPVIFGELEGSHEKIEVMTREDVEPIMIPRIDSIPKEQHAVRSVVPLQRSAASLQGQERQSKDSLSPPSSSRAGEKATAAAQVEQQATFEPSRSEVLLDDGLPDPQTDEVEVRSSIASAAPFDKITFVSAPASTPSPVLMSLTDLMSAVKVATEAEAKAETEAGAEAEAKAAAGKSPEGKGAALSSSPVKSPEERVATLMAAAQRGAADEKVGVIASMRQCRCV
jgi:hypothetical protein